MALRVAVVLLVTVAVLLPLTLSFAVQEPQAAQPEWVTLVALLALAVVNVECGRIFEGGLLRENRPPQGAVRLGVHRHPDAAVLVRPSGGRLDLRACVVAWRTR